jgi:putative redox protein
MSRVEVTVEHVDGDVMQTDTPSGHEVVMDSQAEPGGEGPTPVEMLLVSAGACSLVDVARILRKKQYDVEDLSVTVTGTRREDHPRRFEDVDLVYEIGGDVSQKDLEDACELSVETYCSVLDTLRATPRVGWTATVRS